MDAFNGVDFRVRRLRQCIENNMKEWERINKEAEEDKGDKQGQ